MMPQSSSFEGCYGTHLTCSSVVGIRYAVHHPSYNRRDRMMHSLRTASCCQIWGHLWIVFAFVTTQHVSIPCLLVRAGDELYISHGFDDMTIQGRLTPLTGNCVSDAGLHGLAP